MRCMRCLILIGMLALPTWALADRGPSTEAERAHFVKETRLLETDALGAGARERRRVLFEWISEVPDIAAKVCASLLHEVRSGKYPYAPELTLHEALAAGVFAIEHPDSKDAVAAYLAGVEGALRVYEALLRSRPDARSPVLDELLAKRDRGKLAAHVEKLSKKACP